MVTHSTHKELSIYVFGRAGNWDAQETGIIRDACRMALHCRRQHTLTARRPPAVA